MINRCKHAFRCDIRLPVLFLGCWYLWQVWTTEEQFTKDFASTMAIAADFQHEICKATQNREEMKQARHKQKEADLVATMLL